MFANRWRLLSFALLIAILVALRVQWSRLNDPYTIQDDFRKFHWMLRFEDPELFVDDPLTAPSEIQLGPLRFWVDESRPGYSLLFFLASPLIPPVLFNKLLIFPLLLLSVYFLFRIGEIARDPGTGFTLALTFIVLTTLWTSSTSVAAGLPRSFMAPFLLGIVYFLMTGRYWLATGFALVAATIYLPAAVLGIATITLAIIEPATSRWRYHIVWRRILPLVVFFVLLLLILPFIGGRLQNIWASLLEQNWSFEAVIGDPNFVSGGRWPLFRDFPFQGLGALAENFMNLWLLILLTPLSVVIYLLEPQTYKEYPRVLKLLFMSSVILYVSAWLAIFLTSSIALYFPSRYTQSSLVLVLLLFVVMNLGPAIRKFWTNFQKLNSPSKLLTLATVLIAALTLFVLLERNDYWSRLGAVRTTFKAVLLAAGALFFGTLVLIGLKGRSDSDSELWGANKRLISRREYSILLVIGLAALVLILHSPDDHHFFTIEPSIKDLVKFFQTTPKDSVAAGNPCVLDYIPIAAGRQILFSCEFYHRYTTDEILDNFQAYYASSLNEVQEFCERYGVDYLVVEPDKLDTKGPQWIFFEPYNSILNGKVTSQAGYVLEDIPDSMRIYDDGNLVVLECQRENIDRLSSQATQVDGLGILAYDEVSETLSQAGMVETTIKWFVDKEMLSDYDVCFSVKDRSGKSRQKVCEPLSPDRPTSQWQIPEIRLENYKFRISPYLESGDYSIVVMVNSKDEEDNGHGITIGEIAYSSLPRTFNTAGINSQLTYDVIWANAIALADYDVTESESNTLDLYVRWHTLKRLPDSYKVFVHLRKAGSGEIVSQTDTIPRNWTYPTNWWEVDEIITDTLSIPLNDLGPGKFELWLGFYNDEDGKRLPLLNPIEISLPTKEEAVKVYEFEKSGPGWNG